MKISPSELKGDDMTRDRVIAPGGYIERSRLRSVKPGNMVDAGDDLTPLIEEANRIGRLPELRRRPPFGRESNWITAGWWLNTTGTPINYFRTRWEVPPAPITQASQHVYLFNGMQPASPLELILQPVLEWGQIARSWSVASWIRPDPQGHTHTSLRVRVDPGETLTGVIRLCGQTGGRFTYSCEFEDIPDTRLCVCNMPELVWCVETLEAYKPGGTPPYDLNSASEYPNTDRTAFRGIRLEAGVEIPPLDWEIVNSVAVQFGEYTEVVSDSSTNGRVDIVYGSESRSKKAKE
jgi:hypothetical protein